MGEEKALSMKHLNPEIFDEVNKLFKGIYIKRGFWGSMKCYLPENYRTLAEDIYRMPLRSDDIFVVSFPRSGTTLTQELVWLLANDIDIDKAKSTALVHRYPFLEEYMFIDEAAKVNIKQNIANNPDANLSSYKIFMTPGPDKLAKTESPRFIKTHLPLSLLPPNLLKETKVVYVARDPRDVMVSFYHMSKDNKIMEYNGDLKEYVDLFIRGLVDWAPFIEHIKEAWRQRHNTNLMFLFYEDLCKDLHGCTKRVAEFLGKKYTEEQIAQIAKHLKFDNFKKNEAVDGGNYYKDVGVFKDDAQFVRKGKSGGWHEVFDEETTEKINGWMKESLKDTDIVFPSYK